MGRWVTFAIGVGLWGIVCVSSSAETIYLKNGKKISGTIIKRDTNTIEIKPEDGGRVPYWLDEIERIEGETLQETPIVPQLQQSVVSNESSEEWAEFSDSKVGIRMWYPKGWQAQTGKISYGDGYRLMLTPQPPDPQNPKALLPTVVDLSKIYQASATMKLGDGEPLERLNRYVERFLTTGGATIVEERSLPVQDAATRYFEAHVRDASGLPRRYLIVLAALRRDVLVTMFCESQDRDTFEWLRSKCEAIARRIEPFSFEATHRDNMRVHSQSIAVPTSWKVLPREESNVQRFLTHQDPTKALMVGISFHVLGDQPFKEWLEEEGAILSKEHHAKLLRPATETIIGTIQWTTLVWTAILDDPQSRIGAPVTIESYYALLGNGEVIKVEVFGLSERFAALERKDLERCLASFQK
ncbi:MAG: hypothetical protein HYT88_04945 [Candidatus Omnitrophica bacterium]|nr:hypothetical protein [Candidatus Omnitrophota bacterium]MBI2174457.1 hypothetical protein [Candidatus Omnitrophota bacterium]MBI3009932.1 hypothetical protein [Candidatus Omnitrophota bacterium]